MARMGRKEECKYEELPAMDCIQKVESTRMQDLSDMREEYQLLKCCLDHREAEVLEWRMNGMTLEEIGRRLGSSRQRMQQVERTAIGKLKCHAGNIR
jgi:DNA-directed RNA polymerase sigma subunit (sigma70/sigma32)